MSRIGRKPVAIPEKVKITVTDGQVAVEGPLGTLRMELPAGVKVEIEGSEALVVAPDAARENRGYQGLVRALLANMVEGVTKGYSKTLQINGVGYRAELQGKTLVLTVGYTHPVRIPLPEGIKADVDKQQTTVVIKGIDKQMVGQIAAQVRASKIPEPYKAKGVKYAEETIRRKVGKAGAK